MFDRIREDVRNIRQHDPAARTTWEVLTCYPGLHAVWGHRVSHWLWIRGMKWLARLNSHIARSLTGIEIHPEARLGRRVFIDHGMGVVIGQTAEVGEGCTIYQGVTLGGTSLAPGKRHPTLGRDVVIGAGAKVLGPFMVGDGARVGSNSVVVKEVPAGATVVGIPARIVPTAGLPSVEVVAIAETLGFDAYGVTRDMPDPIADAIGHLLEQVQRLEARVAQLSQALNQMGARLSIDEPVKLELTDFSGGARSHSPVATVATPGDGELTPQRRIA